MAVFLQHSEGTAQWGVWKMDESIADLLALLPRREFYEQQVAQMFRTDHRRLEWLSVRVLLYRLLGEEKEVVYADSGKPSLADGSYCISISHTKGYVAVILGVGADVGIDIEQYGSRIHKVAHKFMREDEVALSYHNDPTWGLLLHWSAKEVMFKCLDAEGIDFREHLYIEPFALLDLKDELQQGTFQAHEYKTHRQRSFLIHYLIHPDFVLTWHKENKTTNDPIMNCVSDSI